MHKASEDTVSLLTACLFKTAKIPSRMARSPPQAERASATCANQVEVH